MNSNQTSTDRSHPERGLYALRRDGDFWEVTIAGRKASFKHELGALYAAYLLLHPRQAVHGVALALKAREKFAQADGSHACLMEPLTRPQGTLCPSEGQRARVRRPPANLRIAP